MKSLKLILLFLIFSVTANSQIIFEPGYFIDNDGERISCLIKNEAWKHNPTSIDYKMTESSESKSMSIMKVREFEINEQLKYERFTVNIDSSSNILRHLSEKYSPEFHEEQVFLKVLVEGKANLYMYTKENVSRYFFNDENTEIEQLIYKRYIVKSDRRYDAEDKIHQNISYQQQLINNFQSDDITRNMIMATGYRKKELLKIFVKYNESTQSLLKNYNDFETSGRLRFGIKGGVNRSSFEVKNGASSYLNTDYETKINYRMGAEVEYVLPFQKNKWAISFEPHYQYYNASVTSGSYSKITDYRTIEFPIGIRHYLFLSDKSKLFLSGSFVFSYSFDSSVYIENGYELEITNSDNLKFGAGYCFNDSFSVELEYNSYRHLLGSYVYWYSQYHTISIVFGYSFFDSGK